MATQKGGGGATKAREGHRRPGGRCREAEGSQGVRPVGALRGQDGQGDILLQ